MAKLTINTYTKTPPYFDASYLKVGEMMIINDNEKSSLFAHVIIKTYDNIVDLSNPMNTWQHNWNIQGRKLLPSESVTLTQE